MSEHTPGPLMVEHETNIVSRADGRLVARTAAYPMNIDLLESTREQLRNENHANACHLVACWNACEGINPGAVPELLGAARLKRNTAIRDPENFVGEWVAVPAEDFDRLRAAIAKVEKGETNA